MGIGSFRGFHTSAPLSARRDGSSALEPKTWSTNSNALRRTLYSQCNADAGCQWHVTPHASNGVVNASSQMLLFLSAGLNFLPSCAPSPPRCC
jgi:hypothetical protein